MDATQVSSPPRSGGPAVHLRRRARAAAGLALLCIGMTSEAFAQSREQVGEWDTLGPALEALGGTNSGVLLPDGRIIYCHSTLDAVLFDPVSGSQSFASRSPGAQGCHAVTLLPDGRLIYVGGADREIYGPGTKQVKAYDATRDTWQVLPNLTDFRWYPSMVKLPDGELLTVGGGGLENPVRVRSSETMNPETMRWSPAGDIAIGNEVSPVMVLYSGEVLMTHRPPQLYDPDTREWRAAADFVQSDRMPDGDHSDHEVILLPDGRAAAIGYQTFDPDEIGSLLEIYDPNTDSWSLGAEQAPVRSRASALLLPNGKVLVLGGQKQDPEDQTPTNAWGYMALVDQYDPETDTWTRMAPMQIAREYHAMPVLAPDGRVIVLGGEESPGNIPSGSVIEVFSPPYLFAGPRPEIEQLDAAVVARNDELVFAVAPDDPVTNVVLMSTIATTHFMDSGNGRYLDLPFTRDGDTVRARVPAEPERSMLGHYILFAMDGEIPSVGKIVRVVSEGAGPDPQLQPTLLPTRLSVRRRENRPQRSRIAMDATIDLGANVPIGVAPLELRLGERSFAIPSLVRRRGAWHHDADDYSISLRPAKNGSSRSKLQFRAKGSAALDLPTDGELVVELTAPSGTSTARVSLERGVFAPGRRRGSLAAPDLAPSSMLLRVRGESRDSLRVTASLAASVDDDTAPDVSIDLGGRFAASVPGTAFEARRGAFVYASDEPGITSVRVDRVTGRVVVRARRVDLGVFTEGTNEIQLDLEVGDAASGRDYRVVRKRRRVRY